MNIDGHPAPEPWLIVDGRKLTGDEITKHHRAHQSSSYHCLGCGGPLPGDSVRYCPHCGAEGVFVSDKIGGSKTKK